MNTKNQNCLIKRLENIDFINRHLISGILVVTPDEEFTIKCANDGFFTLIGFTREEMWELFQNSGFAILFSDDTETARDKFSKALKNASNKTFSIRAKLIHKEKKYMWAHFSGRLYADENGEKHIYCFLDDITSYVNLTEKLQQEQLYNRTILQLTDDVYFDFDIVNKTIQFSEHFAQRFGIPSCIKNFPKSFWGMSSIIPAKDIKSFRRVIADAAKGITSGNNIEVCFLLPTGQPLWFSQHYTIIKDKEEKPIRVIGKLTDVTEQRRWITRLTKKAECDSLTQLLNKEETKKRIELCLQGTKEGNTFALLIIDIDNFKGVNDNLGHQFGDAVLMELSVKLKLPFRETDVIGRIGGDEFAVLMCNNKNSTVVEQKAVELCNSLRHMYSGEKSDYRISCSVGIALAPEHGTTFDELYRNADKALYESKHKGKDQSTVYYPEITANNIQTTVSIEESDRFLSSYFENDIFYSIFEMLYETKDIHTSISMILKMVGQKFKVSRCYIFEFNDDGKFANNIYEWCTQGISPEIDTLQNIPLTDLEPFMSNYSNDGIFYSNDIASLDHISFRTLARQGIKSFLHSAFYEGETIKGFVGFDDCKKKRIWHGNEIAALSYISRILSIFIVKRQISRELLLSYQNNTQMLDNMSGYIYVVDPETHATLYLNKAIIALGAHLGEKCHRIAFFSDKPCENCPIKKLTEMTTAEEEEIYSIRTNRWVKSSVSKLKWNGHKDAILVCCTDITQIKQQNRIEDQQAEANKKPQIMAVDDNITNLNIIRMALEENYDVIPVPSGEKALSLLSKITPDLLLLDVEMPVMNGFDVIKKIKAASAPTKDIPIIFVTAKGDNNSEFEGLNLGAVDYITKPFSFPLLIKRVELHLALVRQQRQLHDYSMNLEKKVDEKTKTITELQYAIVHVLSDMVERRDGSTGGHLLRTQNYLKVFLEAVLTEDIYAEELCGINHNLFIQASQLHDVGKMSIPDNILLKPGKLTSEEFEKMKEHTLIGENAIKYAMSSIEEKKFLEIAATFAGAHHEKWNGSGYPRALAGMDIPIEGRLMAIVDVYDALISERPYKKAFSHEAAVSIIQESSGTHFDPQLVTIFLKITDTIKSIAEQYTDENAERGEQPK